MKIKIRIKTKRKVGKMRWRPHRGTGLLVGVGGEGLG
jgi:hypothetical protein